VYASDRDLAGYLRVCASDDILDEMLDRLPVSAEPERLRYAAVGRALADPKRLCVLESLALGELSVTDLSERVGCQVPNMSQHLAVLRSAGLVTTRRDGSTIFYRLADPRVLEAYRLIQDIAG
jgi:ArsR family transcriptional regulator